MELKEYRESLKRTQTECANEIGIDRQYYSDIERKAIKCGRKTAENIIKWSNNNVTYSDLWDWK